MTNLPLLIEANLAAYLETGALAYPVIKAFSVGDMSSPCVMVKAGRMETFEARTGVFQGSLAITIMTQIDEAGQDAVDDHDDVVSAVYDLMEAEGLFSSFNTQGTLWDAWVNSMDQEATDRSLVSILEYTVSAQNLTIPPAVVVADTPDDLTEPESI